jgi:hypothetical protein
MTSITSVKKRRRERGEDQKNRETKRREKQKPKKEEIKEEEMSRGRTEEKEPKRPATSRLHRQHM